MTEQAMMASPEQIELWRRKVRDGSISIEELRAAVRTLREGRLTAAASGTKTRRATGSAKVSTADVDAILEDFKSL